MAKVTNTIKSKVYEIDKDGRIGYTIDSFEYSLDGSVAMVTATDCLNDEDWNEDAWEYIPVKIESKNFSDVSDVLSKMHIGFFKTPEKLIEAGFYFIRTYSKVTSVKGYHIRSIHIKYVPDEDPDDESVDIKIVLWRDGRPYNDESHKIVVECNGIYETTLEHLIYMGV